MIGFSFRETMEGEFRPAEGGAAEPFRFSFDVRAPSLAGMLTSVSGDATGTVDLGRLADGAPAEGFLELSPFDARLVRYVFTFTAVDGRRLQFDGHKSIRWLNALGSWTTLPGEVRDDGGRLVGGALLRFSFRRHLLPLVAGWRLRISVPRVRRTAAAVARADQPPHGRFAAPDPGVVEEALDGLSSFSAAAPLGYGALLLALDTVSLRRHRRPFASLDPGDAERLLDDLSDGGAAQRALVLAATAPLRMARFGRRGVYESFDAPWRDRAASAAPKTVEGAEPYAAARTPVRLEAEVVVVGTGAGGAVVASELAARGHDVLMVEEGEYFGAEAFGGRTLDAMRRFYRSGGMTGSIGNTVIPIPMGRLVGGSTAVNTGTSWRPPDDVLRAWARSGIDDLGPHLDAVEAELQVGPSDPEALGGPARVVSRGCERLGWSSRPTPRNAPGCVGSGVCDFGCPTGARRSTDVSYVPAALGRGASLATGVRVTGLLPDGGVTGRTTGTGVEVTVRARATVLACGTLLTPLILQRAGVKLRHLGRNLTIHPATTVSGVFDEEVRGFAAVPQGWCVDELTPDGILLLGAGTPIEFGAAQLPVVGAELMDVMDAYDRVASFGVMVSDNPNGAVRAGPRGRPLVAYRLGARECALLHKGTVAVARIFFAAGARRVYAPVRGHRRLLDEADLSRFQGASVAVSDWMTLAAFHPLGTCRMSAWPDEGVVDLDNRVHGMDGVFVADGSVVPSSPRVNPQVTIMAFASRAAERIAAHL